jgi:hypothetical protein
LSVSCSFRSKNTHRFHCGLAQPGIANLVSQLFIQMCDLFISLFVLLQFHFVLQIYLLLLLV